VPDGRQTGHLAGPALALGSMMSVQLGAALAAPFMLDHGALGTTALRLACAALVLLLIARPRLLRFTALQWRAALTLGVTMALMTLCFFEAVVRMPLGPATTIDFLGPLAVAAAALRGWPRIALPLLAVSGVLALTYGAGGWLFDPAGMGFAAASGVGWATYIVLTRKVGRLFSRADGLCLSLSIATLTALPLAMLIAPGEISISELPIIAGLALLVPLIPYSFEMMALRRMDMGAFSILMSLEPAMGALLGFAILGQTLSLRQVAGIVAVMAASVGAVYLTTVKGSVSAG
jgi:inner membrane transporter RhtA